MAISVLSLVDGGVRKERSWLNRSNLLNLIFLDADEMWFVIILIVTLHILKQRRRVVEIFEGPKNVLLRNALLFVN